MLRRDRLYPLARFLLAPVKRCSKRNHAAAPGEEVKGESPPVEAEFRQQ